MLGGDPHSYTRPGLWRSLAAFLCWSQNCRRSQSYQDAVYVVYDEDAIMDERVLLTVQPKAVKARFGH